MKILTPSSAGSERQHGKKNTPRSTASSSQHDTTTTTSTTTTNTATSITISVTNTTQNERNNLNRMDSNGSLSGSEGLRKIGNEEEKIRNEDAKTENSSVKSEDFDGFSDISRSGSFSSTGDLSRSNSAQSTNFGENSLAYSGGTISPVDSPLLDNKKHSKTVQQKGSYSRSESERSMNSSGTLSPTWKSQSLDNLKQQKEKSRSNDGEFIITVTSDEMKSSTILVADTKAARTAGLGSSTGGLAPPKEYLSKRRNSKFTVDDIVLPDMNTINQEIDQTYASDSEKEEEEEEGMAR